jgi:hypothetical protein
MGDLSFENIKNGNWYVIPGHYFNKPARIYKTIYHGDCYIKAIAPSDQQDIVKVPCNENIFEEPKETDVNMDDQEDDFDDEIYLEIKEQNQYVNFVSYDPNEPLDLDDDEKLELYNIFIKIEKSLQKGGRKKKRNIFTRKSKKNKNKIYNNFIGMGKSYKKRRGGSPSKPQGNNNSQNANTISGEDIVTEQQEYMTAEPNNSTSRTTEYQQIDPATLGLNEEEMNEYHKKMQEGNLKAYRDTYGRKGEFNRIYHENDEDNDDDEYPDQFDGGRRRRKTTKRRKSTKRRKTMKRRKSTKRRKN